MYRLLGFLLCLLVTSRADAKWVEGKVDTKDNWAFLARFCFLSLEGQFEYLIEYDKEMGVPNLLLYNDDYSQWPSVYHSSKTCKEREEILNRAGQNQIVRLSHWYPDTEYSGCILKKANKELPASKSTTSTEKPPTTTIKLKNKTKLESLEPSYYDQFLKTTPQNPTSQYPTQMADGNTTWYELHPNDELNVTTTMIPEDELWESIDGHNGSFVGKMNDVEILFNNGNGSMHKIKRSPDLYERFRRRGLNAEASKLGSSSETEKLWVSCHNSRRFRSARERWWFIAISNCDSNKGLDVKYKFLMTNGPDGDFWHEHFSADEFYVLPVLVAYTIAYAVMMIAVVLCSIVLKYRHLLHATYKLYLISIVAQQFGVTLNALAYVYYAAHGSGGQSARIVGQFISGVSETTFILLLVLMAKGYTITRGRLKVSFTVKLTVFMCLYVVTYIILFVYQAKAFDPGEVLYLYESLAGYGLIVLRITAWCMFAYSTFFTVKKYPEKNTFYGRFFMGGTLWFYAGPLFILTANTYLDKWVRESVVAAVLLFISFSGHIMFLILKLPVFANKNFPYHVRTTQIGVMQIPPAPPRPDFDASREKLQRLGEVEGALTREEFLKMKEELEDEYLATLKKTVAMHEVFLQRLATHPVFRNDSHLRVFLEYEQDLCAKPRGKMDLFGGLKIESRMASDQDLKLADTLRYYMRDAHAAKAVLVRRLRCLTAYEAANRNLEKARDKNKDVHAAEQAQADACAKFEQLSARAREELIDFRNRRVSAFRKSLIDLAELEMKHARAQQELFRKSLQVLKECQ